MKIFSSGCCVTQVTRCLEWWVQSVGAHAEPDPTGQGWAVVEIPTGARHVDENGREHDTHERMRPVYRRWRRRSELVSDHVLTEWFVAWTRRTDAGPIL